LSLLADAGVALWGWASRSKLPAARQKEGLISQEFSYSIDKIREGAANT
jgi:hypothetical protein